MLTEDKTSYDRNDKDGKHIIFSYLQIGEIIKTSEIQGDVPKWIQTHPHFINEERRNYKNNTIYVASDTLSWDTNLPGAGTFKMNESLVLTKEGSKRSQWELPQIFRDVKMSYHTEDNWREDYFKCADRGQEFVIDENNEILEWAKNLIHLNTKLNNQ